MREVADNGMLSTPSSVSYSVSEQTKINAGNEIGTANALFPYLVLALPLGGAESPGTSLALGRLGDGISEPIPHQW